MTVLTEPTAVFDPSPSPNFAPQPYRKAAESAPAETLNLAAFWPATAALGPGLRAAVWVQGCPFRCSGCYAPEFIPQRSAHQVSAASLAQAILARPGLSGLTLSGGEPMLQAAALAALVRRVRAERQINVICFTGYNLDDLRQNPPSPGVGELLSEVDLLIDGPYIAEQNHDRGLRGSENQQFHFLSPRLQGYDFSAWPRRVEVNILDGAMLLAGVPSRSFAAALENAMRAPVK